MNEPIKANDLCEVIDGLLGAASPNLGLRVTTLHREGEHTLYGPIWLCQAEYVERAMDGTRNPPPGTAHFAQAWLKKVPKAPLPAKVAQLETTK